MGSAGSGRRRGAISEINVTPLVDVMLVLLIIFMITAPLIQQGIEVQLPKTQSEGLTSDEERLVVTVKRDGKIFVQRAEVKLAELEQKMRIIFETRGNKEVFLRADTKVAYGNVAKTLSALRRAGATRVGMVTEPDV
ncbi:MAG: protein TolR [Deltaproteobacteria bacterium]|nr:protein TolR [Deltaproteobacteria bacterium]MBW2413719.1 protein TolR [Deltaproteobacteria bacterium]